MLNRQEDGISCELNFTCVFEGQINTRYVDFRALLSILLYVIIICCKYQYMHTVLGQICLCVDIFPCSFFFFPCFAVIWDRVKIYKSFTRTRVFFQLQTIDLSVCGLLMKARITQHRTALYHMKFSATVLMS